jgi:phage terminase Nu1 subunit (DNA packaging protein)
MPEQLIVTRAQLAELLGVVPDRITKFVAEGMPVAATGGGRGIRTRIDLCVALPWLWKRRGGGTFDEARTRLANAQADRIERTLMLSAGRLLNADQVSAGWFSLCTIVRTKILAVPTKYKATHPELTLAQLATLDAQLREALEELAAPKPVGRKSA